MVHLPGGRRLGFAEFGDPNGKVILWFHGTPGARRQVPPLARELAARRGVRLIGVERPGVGDSTPHLYESLLGFAEDIRTLADHLGFERFGLVGLSGGGPYVLACAAAMPERVVAGCVLGGVAPTTGEERAEGGMIDLANRFSVLFELLHDPIGSLFSGAIRMVRPFGSQAFDLFVRFMPPGDQVVFQRPEMKEMFIDDLFDATRSGIRSLVYDLVLFCRPWGFNLRDIEVPIRFWQGDADPIVPLSHGHHQAELVPGSMVTVRPTEGHMGALDAAEEILDFILDAWAAERPTGELPEEETVAS